MSNIILILRYELFAANGGKKPEIKSLELLYNLSAGKVRIMSL